MTTTQERTPELAFDLVSGYRTLLSQAGYKQTQVDTLTSPDGDICVRFGYAGGEWRVTTAVQSGRPWTVKIDWRYPLPSMEQMMEYTVQRGGSPADRFLDATREMCLRGTE